jgi:hypothetical protein
MPQKSDIFFIRYAIGSIFSFTKISDINLVLEIKNNENLFLNDGSMDTISVELDDSTLLVKTERWGRSPVFYFQNNEHVYISSRIELIYLANRDYSFKINKFIRQNLEIKGYHDLDQTLFCEIHKLNPDHSLIINFNGILKVKDNLSLPSNWGALKLSDEWIHQSVVLLKKATVNLIEKGCTHIAISGGCDSRLLLNLIPESYRSSLIAYNKVNPKIGAFNDNDHLLARKATNEMGYRFMPIENSKNYYSFLDPEIPSPPVLCGLYGGEFLGGSLKWILPEEMQESFEEFGTQEYKQLLLASINSFRTIFYRKTEASWASPYTNLYNAKTPFLDSDFLDHLVLLNFREIHEYRVYDKIWKLPKFAKSAEIGFESGINFFYSYPRTVFEKNPKMYPENEPKSLGVEIDENLEYLEKSIRKASLQNIFF